MEIPLDIVAFIAIILGIIGRTYYPYLRKLGDYKAETAGTGITKFQFDFDIKFIATAIFSGIVTAFFVYPMFVFPDNQTIFNVFLAGFVFAWGFNDGINRIAN
jgi:hypothetical protein